MNTIHSNQLSTLQVLFREKEIELKQLIAGLQLQNVNDDSRFKLAVQRIKHQVLLEPAIVGEPQITGQNQSTQTVPANYQNLRGGSRDVYNVTVDFPFSGSSDILKYRANGLPLSMDIIYQSGGRTISVEVQLTKLDKTEALNRAKQVIATTLELIRQHNPFITEWSSRTESTIEELAKQKRQELLDFFS